MMTFDKHGNAYAPCTGCGRSTMLGQLQPVRRSAGFARLSYDARPRGPAGSRIGAEPDIKQARVERFATQQLCPSCRGVAPKPVLKPRLIKRQG